MPPSVDHPYPFPLTVPKHTENAYDVTMENPLDWQATRKRRNVVSSNAKLDLSGGVSESMVMHQRKLRDTEARIDHALDLVTRSFGVKEESTVSRRGGPHTSEVRKIRETLTKTQRILADDQKDKDKLNRQIYSTSMKNHRTPIVISKKKNLPVKAKVPSQPHQPSVRIYRTNPIASRYFAPPSPRKIESQKEVIRSKVLSVYVIQGNTHIYEKTNPEFINSFANVESFKTIDDSNPAGLPRYRTKVDMSGFLDNEITLQCDGKKVIISGNRPRKNITNERKVVEVIELPPGVFPEKLRIARDKEGALYVEERWSIS